MITVLHTEIKQISDDGEWSSIYYDGAVNGCNFTNCNAKVDSAMGGAVFIGGECKVNSCNFISCFATMGGALFVVEGDVGYCNFTNCYINNNSHINI